MNSEGVHEPDLLKRPSRAIVMMATMVNCFILMN